MSVYILHFAEKLHNAQHYVGCTNNIERRMREHLHCYSGGSKLVRAVVKRGTEVILAKVYPYGDRNLEKRIKAIKKTSLICPICLKGKRVNVLKSYPELEGDKND